MPHVSLAIVFRIRVLRVGILASTRTIVTSSGESQREANGRPRFFQQHAKSIRRTGPPLDAAESSVLPKDVRSITVAKLGELADEDSPEPGGAPRDRAEACAVGAAIEPIERVRQSGNLKVWGRAGLEDGVYIGSRRICGRLGGEGLARLDPRNVREGSAQG